LKVVEGEDGEMKKRNFTRNSYGLAGVIEALLIIALVVMVLATIQLYYVPQIMEEKESDHMDEVLNQFSNLKSVIEVQSLMGAQVDAQPIAYSPMSSPITLGNEQLPYFVTTGALGQVNVFDKYYVNSTIDLLPKPPDFLSGIPLTSIRFIGDNAYFVDQRYILEGGGIILKQRDGESMKVVPPITIENSSDEIIIYYTIPLFVSQPGKNITGGSDTVFVRTNYTKYYTHSDESITWLYIYSDYLAAWNQSLINDNKGLLWEYYNNGYINVTYNDPVSPTRIEIKPGTKDLDVELTIVEIGAQIGPGFIINE
jgi:hypothetical protein